MCSLAVGLVSCSVCVNRRRLRCTIWVAALRTASSWRCAAAPIQVSACLVRCWCRARVTALSHSCLRDQGIPEEVFSGLMRVAVGMPAFVLL